MRVLWDYVARHTAARVPVEALARDNKRPRTRPSGRVLAPGCSTWQLWCLFAKVFQRCTTRHEFAAHDAAIVQVPGPAACLVLAPVGWLHPAVGAAMTVDNVLVDFNAGMKTVRSNCSSALSSLSSSVSFVFFFFFVFFVFFFFFFFFYFFFFLFSFFFSFFFCFVQLLISS